MVIGGPLYQPDAYFAIEDFQSGDFGINLNIVIIDNEV